MKYLKLITLFAILCIQNSFAKEVILVSFWGDGHTNENLSGEIGDTYSSELKKISAFYFKSYMLTHHKQKESTFDKLISETKCHSSYSKDLIIIGSSWGSKNAYKLAKKYFKQCNKKVTAFFYLDAINKPSPWSFTKTPKAKICINYYQRNNWIRGKKIDTCKNINLSSYCDKKLEYHRGKNYCHIIASVYTLNNVVKDINNLF